MILAVLPIDLYQVFSAKKKASNGLNDSDTRAVLHNWWRFNYWSVYLLCMVLLPFLSYFYSSLNKPRSAMPSYGYISSTLSLLVSRHYIFYLVWKEDFRMADLPGFLIAIGIRGNKIITPRVLSK